MPSPLLRDPSLFPLTRGPDIQSEGFSRLPSINKRTAGPCCKRGDQGTDSKGSRQRPGIGGEVSGFQAAPAPACPPAAPLSQCRAGALTCRWAPGSLGLQGWGAHHPDHAYLWARRSPDRRCLWRRADGGPVGGAG